ncbi:hypothetical protein F4781DRAFT_406274 [Annulohypoxylon bovei var. microspora]|nr:hypothetical protein F4781DRAFT_406274 [Annulohypoxylon bovei var. microspora]
MEQPDELKSFTWNSCDDFDDQRRISVKEEALQVGIRYCEKLIERLDTFLLDDTSLSDGSDSTTLGHTVIEGWIMNCRDLITRHQAFQVPVGVAGSTGSGKTSALNALLDYRELLPTDNAEAATAVPCKVAYNNDNRPEFKFQAFITFRKREDLVKQLDQFFGDLMGRNELQDMPSKSDEDHDALRLANSIIKPTLELVKTVFGLGDDDLKEKTTESLLAVNIDVDQVLGTIKSFNSGGPDQFSDMIRHYMDSTSAKHGDHGLKFPAWPLVDEVEILVKSDILRNGVVLVDLPGLADTVESRAAVAERYFPKLAATLIVSPARRAADDSTSVKLLSDHQELRMKLDGKFHKRGYCVVVSQIDEIERKSDFKKEWARSNQELQDLITQEQELKSQKAKNELEKKEAIKSLSKLIDAFKAANSKLSKPKKSAKGFKKSSSKLASAMVERSRAMADIRKKKMAIARLKDVAYNLEKDIKNVEGNIIFICVNERNQSLTARIQQDFQTRQAQLASNHGDDLRATYDGQVSICPISSKAYWQCSDEEETLAGFPSRQYSGIPNLKKWISYSTIPEREAHADSILHDILDLYNVIQTWSKKVWSQSRLPISKKQVKKEVMSGVYEHMKKELDSYWEKLNQSVQEKNPLRDKEESLRCCDERCLEVVRGWSYKNPDDDASTAKVHWNTYQANIHRQGGRFVSKSSCERINYYWMQDITDVLLETIVQDWNNSLNHDIPNLGRQASSTVDVIWGDFLKRLRICVQETIPQLLPFLDDVTPNLDAIKTKVKDRVQKELVAISKNASHVHPEMVKMIQRTWEPAFVSALRERGYGSLTRRKEIMMEYALTSSGEMYDAAFASLVKKLKKKFDGFPKMLKKISALSVDEVKAHIHALLDNVFQQNVEVQGAPTKKSVLQQYVREVLLKWDLEWKVPETPCDIHINAEDMVLPTQYRQIKDEDEMDLDDDGSITMDEGEA